jgi:glycosyltransferase involved in cell wall biosynthesis
VTMKISVVIPAYNAVPYLKETIESALSQSYAPHEIIVVDDGSTDGTADIARSFGSKIRLLQHANRGVAASRNRGIEEATGDWIALLDADDAFLKDKLLLQAGAVKQNPSALFVYTGMRLLFEDGSTRDCLAPSQDQLWPALRYRSLFVPSSVVIQRSALLACGGFDGAFSGAADWELWLRFMRINSRAAFAAVAEPVTIYRVVAGSMSSNVMGMLAEQRALLDSHLLADLSGVRRFLWRRRIWAKFLYDSSLVLRQQGNSMHLSFGVQSLMQWPCCGRVVPALRYKVVAHMLSHALLRRFQRLGPAERQIS